MNGDKANILGVRIDSTSKEEVLKTMIDCACNDTSMIVFTPNPEFLVEADKDNRFRELLNKADINLPDGIGLVWASRILSTPIHERVSGADVVEKLLEYADQKSKIKNQKGEIGNSGRWIIGIAGARRGVLKESTELINRLKVKYPNITFINLDNPNFKFEILNLKSISNDQILNVKSNTKYKMRGLKSAKTGQKFQIVLACQGMKKQEEWIMENKDKLNANVFMGVGGSLDFITGFTKRAPLLMRQAGMEWLWRGVQKPKHFLRIWKAVFVFNWLILKEAIKNR